MILLGAFIVYAIALSVALGRAGHRSCAVEGGGTRRGRPARIVVVGASGGTGRQLVEQALARGYEVTAFVRNPAKLAIEHPRLALACGDVLDAVAVDALVAGHDAVLCALGHRRYLGPTRILSNGTRNILRAMETHAVPRLVCETSLGIGDSTGRMGLYYTLFVVPVILPFYYWDKTRQERAIAASAAEWVIVRPAVLTNHPRRGGCRHGRGIGSFLSTARVPRADVAAFMLDQLESDDYLRAAPGVAR